MGTEDKLHHDERLRLEALAQAVVASGAAAGRVQATGDIVRRAADFADFIATGQRPR
jgi:hypothetical protein